MTGGIGNNGGLRQQYDYDGVNRLSFVKEFYLTPPYSTLWSRSYGYEQYGNRWISATINKSESAPHVVLSI